MGLFEPSTRATFLYTFPQVMHRRSKVIPSEHYGDCWLSYKLMGKLKNKLSYYLKSTPEYKVDRRIKLSEDIEKLRMIRVDMNNYMKTL